MRSLMCSFNVTRMLLERHPMACYVCLLETMPSIRMHASQELYCEFPHYGEMSNALLSLPSGIFLYPQFLFDGPYKCGKTPCESFGCFLWRWVLVLKLVYLRFRHPPLYYQSLETLWLCLHFLHAETGSIRCSCVLSACYPIDPFHAICALSSNCHPA